MKPPERIIFHTRDEHKGCGHCEHFNLHYYQDEPEGTRGRWGTCMFPYGMNISTVEERATIPDDQRPKVWITDWCIAYQFHYCNYYG